MKKLVNYFTLTVLLSGTHVANSQTVIYSEDFDGALTWSINTDATAEGAFPNEWYISCEEEGVGAGACGAVCGVGNQTLHVSTNVGLFGDLGASYVEFGGGGNTNTNRRAESANISTIGQSNLTLNFDMIGNGGNPFDYTEVFYSTDGGVVWVSLATPLTSACCGGPCTGTEQGLWQTNTYLLPAACDNILNLRISFVWKNIDDPSATDPSFAADNIEITTPLVGAPTAAFTTPITNICEATCINFTDMSTVGAGPYVYAWTFTGGVPNTSAVQNPVGICYPAAGSYAVSLTVTDITGTDNETTASYITVTAAPDAGADASGNVCNDATTLNLNTLLVGADPGGVWTETSGTPSLQFTPGTGVLNGNGLPLGNVYTFNYTVAPTAPCVANNVATFTITVIDCSIPVITASFTPSSTNICVGDCITFAEASTGAGLIGWGWQFTNGTPSTSITQNPGSVCFNVAGSQNVTLTITNGTIFDDTTITITVNALPIVTANANPGGTICTGDPVILTGGGAATYTWDNGVTNGVAFTPATTQTYIVTGTAANSCQNTATVTVTLTVCVPMIAGFSYPDNICMGDCITFQDTTTGTPNSWTWDFGGGSTPNTSTDQNPVVCFDALGTFNIQLTTTDAGGNTSSTTNSISVFGMPMVTAELDTVIEIGGSAVLIANGSGPGTYLWSPEYGNLDCDTCSTTFVSPEVDTNYVVIFTDVNGCPAKDSVRVYVNFVEAVGVPQAFSPNDDSNNDILFVKGFGIVTMKFVIYNRYGEKVFETSDQNIGWDGKFKNRDENPGVFVWVLEYTVLTGKGGLLSGNTTLVR